ncbi:MAG: hypothetical protein ACFFG0_36580, partial [Candidatus Thorarchaeota archaeon]
MSISFLYSLSFAEKARAGKLYEQIVPTSYDNFPTIKLYGKTSMTTLETLYITTSSTYCSTCKPFYYWQVADGAFVKQQNDLRT